VQQTPYATQLLSQLTQEQHQKNTTLRSFFGFQFPSIFVDHFESKVLQSYLQSQRARMIFQKVQLEMKAW